MVSLKENAMLGPAEIAAIITATKGAVDIFDRMAGQVKAVLTGQPKEAEGDEDRWKYKISGEDKTLVVRQSGQTVQTVTGKELSERLEPMDLALVRTYESKMEAYFKLWQAVYQQKDVSQDPLVNAKTDTQLTDLILKMRGELLGILAFLEKTGIRLDDHYKHIRHLVTQAEQVA
jgi:molybdopterin-guanine dinucleotide biosynthesis protein